MKIIFYDIGPISINIKFAWFAKTIFRYAVITGKEMFFSLK